MTDTELKVFKSVYQHQSVSACARELFMTQSSVSRIIILLEKRYQTQFFIRERKKMIPTEAGSVFYTSTEHILSEMNFISQTFLPANEEKPSFKIGSIPFIAEMILGDLFPVFLAGHSDENISILVHPSQILEWYFRDHKIDVFFSTEPNHGNDTVSTEIGEEKFSVFAGAGSDVPDHLTLKDLERYPLLLRNSSSFSRMRIDTIFRDADIRPNILLESISVRFIAQMVSRNLGLTILSDYYLKDENFRKNLRKIKVEGWELQQKLYLTCRKSQIDHPLVKELFSLLKDV